MPHVIRLSRLSPLPSATDQSGGVDVPARERRGDRANAGLTRARPGSGQADLLDHQLSGVVVAVREHLGDHVREWAAIGSLAISVGVGRRHARPGTARDLDALLGEDSHELTCAGLVGVVRPQSSPRTRESLTMSASYGPASMPGHATTPAGREELVVVAAAVAANGPVDAGDAGRRQVRRPTRRTTSC